jgi:hypothetical protein
MYQQEMLNQAHEHQEEPNNVLVFRYEMHLISGVIDWGS